MAFGFGLCPALGTLFVTAATVLLIFANIGQIRVNQVVPRNIYLVSVTNYGLGQAIGAITNQGNVTDIYGNPNQAQNSYEPASGLRTEYSWGLWSYCGGYNAVDHPQFCVGTHFAQEFRPVQQTYVRDTPAAQAQQVTTVIPEGTFTADSYLVRCSDQILMAQNSCSGF